MENDDCDLLQKLCHWWSCVFSDEGLVVRCDDLYGSAVGMVSRGSIWEGLVRHMWECAQRFWQRFPPLESWRVSPWELWKNLAGCIVLEFQLVACLLGCPKLAYKLGCR